MFVTDISADNDFVKNASTKQENVWLHCKQIHQLLLCFISEKVSKEILRIITLYCVLSDACAFPAMTSQNVCSENGL